MSLYIHFTDKIIKCVIVKQIAIYDKSEYYNTESTTTKKKHILSYISNMGCEEEQKMFKLRIKLEDLSMEMLDHKPFFQVLQSKC